MQTNDTISAIATPHGVGGIGIIRISGTQALSIAKSMFIPYSTKFIALKPWTMHRGHISDSTGELIDDVLIVFMPGPHSFSGEDIVEIHCHGGLILINLILEITCYYGARLATKGEFSYRAFLNGRMDLAQAEAVAELINAPCRTALRMGIDKLDGSLTKNIHALREKLEYLRMLVVTSLDFSEDEVESLSSADFIEHIDAISISIKELCNSYERNKCWNEGALVVIAGDVNVGKSSLLNALLGRNRALVTPIAGTTRDFLEEHLNIQGLPINLTDTAGMRDTTDIIESMGIEKSIERMESADVVVLLIDANNGFTAQDKQLLLSMDLSKLIVLWNKSDLKVAPWAKQGFSISGSELASLSAEYDFLSQVKLLTSCSALHSLGIEEFALSLRNFIIQTRQYELTAGDVAPNLRQLMSLKKALAELDCLKDELNAHMTYDVCTVRLDSAAIALGEVTGLNSSDEVLQKVFSSFCIGK